MHAFMHARDTRSQVLSAVASRRHLFLLIICQDRVVFVKTEEVACQVQALSVCAKSNNLLERATRGEMEICRKKKRRDRQKAERTT